MVSPTEVFDGIRSIAIKGGRGAGRLAAGGAGAVDRMRTFAAGAVDRPEEDGRTSGRGAGARDRRSPGPRTGPGRR